MESKKGMTGMEWIMLGVVAVIGLVIVLNVAFSGMPSVNQAAAYAVANSTGTPSAPATNIMATIWPYLYLLVILGVIFAAIGVVAISHRKK